MKAIWQILLTILCTHQAWAENEQNHQLLSSPKHCQTLACVRANIDLIDKEIVSLIGQRLTYAKRAGEIKQRDHKSLSDPAREKAVLLKVKKQAEEEGYSGSAALEIFKVIIAQSYQIQYN
jgi:chorismate mutase